MHKHLILTGLFWLCIAGVITGIGVTGQAFYTYWPLWQHTQTTTGEVIGFKTHNFKSTHHQTITTDNIQLPVILFQPRLGQTVQFTDNFARPRRSVGDRVTVVYNDSNPQQALIDKGLVNWLPLYTGLIILFVSFLGTQRFRAK